MLPIGQAIRHVITPPHTTLNIKLMIHIDISCGAYLPSYIRLYALYVQDVDERATGKRIPGQGTHIRRHRLYQGLQPCCHGRRQRPDPYWCLHHRSGVMVDRFSSRHPQQPGIPSVRAVPAPSRRICEGDAVRADDFSNGICRRFRRAKVVLAVGGRP